MGNKTSQNNNMEFGMRISSNSILEEIKNGDQKNLVLSPLSLHIALNMLASGSTGRTLEQLLRFLQSNSITQLNAQSSILMELASGDVLGDLPPPDDLIHQNPSSGHSPIYQDPLPQKPRERYPYFQNQSSVKKRYRSPSGPMICLVNGIWVDKRYPMKRSFKQLVEDVYKANAQSVDFLNQARQVVDEINSWAREASKGHIDRLFTKTIKKDAILVLANALYFKGTWANIFYAEDTRDEDFHLLNGETIRVPFMKKSGTCNSYGSFEGFKLLKMPYESGNLDKKRYAMYVFLPDRNDGLQELVEKFNSNPRLFLENRELQEVALNKLWLPKLKYEYELNTLKSMKELGLDLPFDKMKAEIEEMVETTEGVFVSDAIQKSYIQVNEEGTIATAVLAFSGLPAMAAWDMKPAPAIHFVADHPFLFTIKEEVSDIVLFVGAALNPLA